MNDIGIIGLGTLGSALARGLHRALPALRIYATTRGNSPMPHFVTACASNEELVRATNTVLLCVKPRQAQEVLREIAPAVDGGHQVVSTCAAVSLESIKEALPGVDRVARAMPNIACEFNEGITGVAFGSKWPEHSREDVKQLFSSLGEAIVLEERHFDAVTAISGCGPAYVCVITEALSDAAVKAGLPREVARRMAVQMLLGSALLIRSSNEHPAAIRDRVTTPGGCTIDALTALEEGGLRATLIGAVTTAAAKSAALSREMPYVYHQTIRRAARQIDAVLSDDEVESVLAQAKKANVGADDAGRFLVDLAQPPSK